MALFAVSDLHLSLGTDKPMDIFKGWSNYVEKIKTNWNNVVTDKDTVIIVGDISWALKLEQTFEDMKFIDSLPGTKVFIKGNHDFWWNTKSRVEKYFSDNNFNTLKIIFNSAYSVDNISVCGSRGWFLDSSDNADKKILNRELGRVETSIREGLKTGFELVVFLHYPPIYNNFKCEPMIELLKKYNIKKCYYGHIHGKNSINRAFVGKYNEIDFSLISCDYTGFKPIVVG